MLPLFLLIAFRTHPGGLRWWLPIPLFVVWLLLLPIMLLLLPIVLVILGLLGMRPFASLGALWRAVASFRGADLDFDDGHLSIQVCVV